MDNKYSAAIRETRGTPMALSLVLRAIYFFLCQTGVLSRFHYFMCIHHENNNSVDLYFSIWIGIGGRSIRRQCYTSTHLPFTLFQKSFSSLSTHPQVGYIMYEAPCCLSYSWQYFLQRWRKSKHSRYRLVTVKCFVITPTVMFITCQHFCWCNYVIRPTSDEPQSLES